MPPGTVKSSSCARILPSVLLVIIPQGSEHAEGSSELTLETFEQLADVPHVAHPELDTLRYRPLLSDLPRPGDECRREIYADDSVALLSQEDRVAAHAAGQIQDPATLRDLELREEDLQPLYLLYRPFE
jgi:hypothetical protein